MHRLHAKLLGGFSLTFGDSPVTSVNSPRMQALLAYLMLQHQQKAPHPRQQLAFLFWPDSSEAQAYTNLRQLLHGLRRALPHVALYSQDPAAVCLIRLALTQWYRGYSEQALAKSREALALARRLDHPFSLAYVLHWSAWLYQHMRDADATQKQVDESLRFSLKQEFAYWSSQGTLLQGWVLLQQGRTKQALAHMQAELSAFRATETEVGQPYYLGLVAEALVADGQPDAALRVVDEALSMIDSRGEYWAQAQLYRLKGEILLARRPVDYQAAATLFAQSLAAARQRSAKWLELRAASSGHDRPGMAGPDDLEHVALRALSRP